MPGKLLTILRDRVPGFRRIERLPRQFLGISPFDGDVTPARVPLFSPRSGRPTLPFPHPWNYREPLRILETYFWGADSEQGSARHNRYLNIPGFTPVLVTRDPQIIRAIATETGDKEGQFDRDTLPSVGIARATGKDTLLFANGPTWKRQKKLSTPPFGRTTLFQPEQMHEFEETFRHTIQRRLDALNEHLKSSGSPARVRLEPEIKAVMLELLVVNFFGAQVPYDQISGRYVPALERVIDHIVSDTVINRIGLPLRWLPRFNRRIAEIKAARAGFEELTDIVIATRKERVFGGNFNPTRRTRPCAATSVSSSPALWKPRLRTQAGRSLTWPETRRRSRRSTTRSRTSTSTLPRRSTAPSTWAMFWTRRSA